MKPHTVKLGPLALLLTIISICLTVLSVLSYTTARADLALAERYANTVTLRYELEAEGQNYLRYVNSKYNAPGGSNSREFEKDGSRLIVELSDEDGDGIYSPSKWIHEREWEENDDIGELWNGL